MTAEICQGILTGMIEHTERVDDTDDTGKDARANGKVHVKVTLSIDGDWRSSPLKVISGVTEGIRSLDGTLLEAVRIARKNGITWEEIGKALGVSRQSAWERFSMD